jgi:hypothetical protein
MMNSQAAPPPLNAGGQASPEVRPAPSRRRRLVLTAALAAFLLWIGYLAFLAVTSSHPVVLSRPQVLVSNLIVVAQLTGGPEHPEPAVVVKEVAWSADPAKSPQVGAKLDVVTQEFVVPDYGWLGPREYILCLSQDRNGSVRLTPIPPSPGMGPAGGRIYVATPSTREQLAQILKQFRRQ